MFVHEFAFWTHACFKLVSSMLRVGADMRVVLRTASQCANGMLFQRDCSWAPIWLHFAGRRRERKNITNPSSHLWASAEHSKMWPWRRERGMQSLHLCLFASLTFPPSLPGKWFTSHHSSTAWAGQCTVTPGGMAASRGPEPQEWKSSASLTSWVHPDLCFQETSAEIQSNRQGLYFKLQ